MLKAFLWYVIIVDYSKCCILYYLVPRYILGRVLQSSITVVSSQKSAFFYESIHNENEFGSNGLGELTFYSSIMDCVTCFIQQNENVNRPYTSQHLVKDLRRPDRRTAMKVLVKKSFDFVDLLWIEYTLCNKTDLRLLLTKI